MSILKTVFWDVDGTLADTEISGHRVAFNLAFEDYNLNWIWDKNTYRNLLKIQGGCNRIKFYADSLKTPLEETYARSIHSRKQFYYQQQISSGKIPLRTGVKRLVEQLNDNGIDQYIVTTSSRKAVEALIINHFKSLSDETFKGFVTYEDVVKHKPFPDAYFKAIQLSGVNPENILVIEDSRPGLISAHKASLACIVTLTSWNKSAKEDMLEARAILNGLGDSNQCCKVYRGQSCKAGQVTVKYLEDVLNEE